MDNDKISNENKQFKKMQISQRMIENSLSDKKEREK